jgi:hypothetical protein
MNPRVILYPDSNVEKTSPNPFIRDFKNHLRTQDLNFIDNEVGLHPILFLLKNIFRAKIVVLNWFENVPTYNYGPLQFAVAYFLLLIYKLTSVDVIWFYHNKGIHDSKMHSKFGINMALIIERKGLKLSKRVISFSDEVLNLIPEYKHKLSVFYHPVKNNLQNNNYCSTNYDFDVLIWGEINPYKGVLDYLEFRNEELHQPKILVYGRCVDENYKEKLLKYQDDNTHFIFEFIKHEDIINLRGKVKKVLITHLADSVLCSATLADSLSYGYSVIGPNIGAFRDLSNNKDVDVETYDDYGQILEHIGSCKNDLDYSKFIRENSWTEFSLKFKTLIS